MAHVICLDGNPVRLEADRVVVELGARDGEPADHEEEAMGAACACCGDSPWHPVMSYRDGTTVYLHAGASEGYRVAAPRPHRWVITFLTEGAERIARLAWVAS